MSDTGIHITELPELNNPILIAGFDGWGNALNVSEGMATYLIGKLNARKFARLNPDVFYRFDESLPYCFDGFGWAAGGSTELR